MNYTNYKKEIPLNTDFDIIVAGGGPSGIAAATAAAREGSKVLLLESSGMLGGMATKGLVSSWTPFTDEVRIIYGGLAKRALLETKKGMTHVPEDKYDWVSIDYEKLKIVYDKMVNEVGVHTLFHSFVCDVVMKDKRNIDALIVANKSGLCAYKAKVYIDCTGDADICAWAGNEYTYGDENGEVQPSTLCFVISGIDEETFIKQDLYGGNPNSPIRKIAKDPEFCVPDTHFVCGLIGEGTLACNSGHIWDVDPTDPESVTQATFEGRTLDNDFLRGLKKYCPEAFKNAYLVSTASVVGSRESRRIVGDYVFTTEDWLDRKSFDDEIGRNNYFIDIHKSKAEEQEMKIHSDNRYDHYKKGESHGIPFSILCPRDLDNVYMAGRSVSTDRITQGSLRVMPCCLVEGEAVGIAADLVAKSSTPNIHKADIKTVQRKMVEHDGYLPNFKE